MAGLNFGGLTVVHARQHAIHRTGVEPEPIRVSARTFDPAQRNRGVEYFRAETECQCMVSNVFDPGRLVSGEIRFPAPIYSAYTRPNTIVGHCLRTAPQSQRP